MMGGKGTVLILLMSALLSLGHGLDWMGAGNWTVDNLTALWTKLNSFDSTAQQNPMTFVSTLSDGLNRDWHPAWNVVLVVYTDSQNHDSVLYGYGFNGHWFWANGMKTANNQYYSFIIWKDYNCMQWRTLDSTSMNFVYQSFPDAISTSIITKNIATSSSRPQNDIWKAAQNLQAMIPAADSGLFQDQLAYSVVAIPVTQFYLYYQVCAKDYIIVPNFCTDTQGNANGLAVVFQMRDS